MAIYNNIKLLNPVKIEISYIDWGYGYPCKEVWSSDIVEYNSEAINKWIEKKVANMLKFDEPLNRYNVYLDGKFKGDLIDLVDIITK